MLPFNERGRCQVSSLLPPTPPKSIIKKYKSKIEQTLTSPGPPTPPKKLSLGYDTRGYDTVHKSLSVTIPTLYIMPATKSMRRKRRKRRKEKAIPVHHIQCFVLVTCADPEKGLSNMLLLFSSQPPDESKHDTSQTSTHPDQPLAASRDRSARSTTLCGRSRRRGGGGSACAGGSCGSGGDARGQMACGDGVRDVAIVGLVEGGQGNVTVD